MATLLARPSPRTTSVSLNGTFADGDRLPTGPEDDIGLAECPGCRYGGDEDSLVADRGWSSLPIEPGGTEPKGCRSPRNYAASNARNGRSPSPPKLRFIKQRLALDHVLLDDVQIERQTETGFLGDLHATALDEVILLD